jgi:superfamily II DNA or RNA helicase
MERAVVVSDAAAVRALIASRVCPPAETEPRLGAIELRPHQLSAVGLCRDALERVGGALLADEVGLGKTYVALAIARLLGTTLILAPSALREMWEGALAATGVRADFASYEALSRGWRSRETRDLVIADEAHHLRNRSTVRYRSAAALTRGAHVLLLTATPVHNRAAELRALLALFLGERAWTLSPSELARYVVRRTREHASAPIDIPSVTPMRWLTIDGDEDLLDALCALPPPVPPIDGGDAGALCAYSLLRLWASSRGALREGLRRRLALASALCEALESGRHPTRSELRAWSFADDALQLAFPELIVQSRSTAAAVLVGTVREHVRAVRAILARIGGAPGPDTERAVHLIELRRRHPGRKLVAFSQYAGTVRALFSCMRREGAVAALTATGGVVAGGALTRADVLARFAPRAQGKSPPTEAERIDLLLTTDLLSEGVNLQDASVVVHLDLPWTAARLEQRVGRAARLGAEHPVVDVYALTPPAPAERVLQVERRLREKIGAAAGEVGITGAMLSLLETGGVGSSAPEHAERLRMLLSRWSTAASLATMPGGGDSRGRVIPVAGVCAARPGLIALFGDANRTFLAAAIDGPLSDHLDVVARAAELAGGEDTELPPDLVTRAMAATAEFCERRRAESDADVRETASGPLRRALVRRISAIARRSPLLGRLALAPRLAEARRVARVPLGAGAESALEFLVRADMSDDVWLRALVAFGQSCRREQGLGGVPAPLALLVLRLEP